MRRGGSAAILFGVLMLGSRLAHAQELAVAPHPGDSPTGREQQPAPATPVSALTAGAPGEAQVSEQPHAAALDPAPVASAAGAPPNPAIAAPSQRRASASCSCPCGANANPEPNQAESSSQRSYGWTLVAADLINLGGHAAIAILADENQRFKDVWPYTLTGVFVLSGPVVHLLQGHPSQAGQSLGARVAIPLAFGLVGGLVAQDTGDGRAVGGAVGMVAASVFDALVLGRGDNAMIETGRQMPVTTTWFDHTRRAAGASLLWAF